MSFFDNIIGRTALRERRNKALTADETAVERYQQVLGNAPTEKIEQVHVEAFSKLTPAQLDILFEQFTNNGSPPDGRPANARPATLAGAEVRAEQQQPGTLTRTLGAGSGRDGTASILGTVAAYVIASEIVSLYLWSGFYAEAAVAGPPEASGTSPTEDTTGIFDGGGYGF